MPVGGCVCVLEGFTGTIMIGLSVLATLCELGLEGLIGMIVIPVGFGVYFTVGWKVDLKAGLSGV